MAAVITRPGSVGPATVDTRTDRNPAAMTQQIRRVLVRSLDDITLEQVPAPVPGDDELIGERGLTVVLRLVV